MLTSVTDVTIVLHDCHTSKSQDEVVQTLRDAGLEDLQFAPNCVVTGYINSHMLAALKIIEHIGYVRTGHTYWVEVPPELQ
jgi:hypothetical protein